MFCLRKKICRNVSWICRLISNNKNLTWSRNGIYAYMTINCLLGQGYINISGSYNLINLWNDLGSISQGTNSLGASYLIDCGSTGFICRYQGIRVNLTILSRRSHHNNLFYPCHLGRKNIHKNRRRIDSLSSRNIYANPLKGCHLLTQDRAIRFTVKPTILFLLFVVATNIKKGFFNDFYELFIYLLIGFLNLFFSNLNG